MAYAASPMTTPQDDAINQAVRRKLLQAYPGSDGTTQGATTPSAPFPTAPTPPTPQQTVTAPAATLPTAPTPSLPRMQADSVEQNATQGETTPAAPAPTLPAVTTPAATTPTTTTPAPSTTGGHISWADYSASPDKYGIGSFIDLPNGHVGTKMANGQIYDTTTNAYYTGASSSGTSGSNQPIPGGDPRAYFMSLVQGLAPTPDSLKGLADKLAPYGIKVLTNAEGVAGKIQLPDGTIVDVIQGAGAGGQAWQWLTGDGGSGGGTPDPTVAPNPWTEAIRNMVMQQLQQLTSPFSVDSPEVAVPYGAAQYAVDRANQQARTALAERLYATGDLNSGSLTRGVLQNIEAGGTQLGQIRGNLVTQALTQRMNQLNTLLSMALGSGQTETAQQIQMAMAQLQAEINREQMGVQMSEFAQNQNTNASNTATGA